MTENAVLKRVEILLVEDNPGDVRLIREALSDAKVSNMLHVAMDGPEALEYLLHAGDNPETPRPDIILLDLNLPRMNGREVLQEIKSHPQLKRIPVLVLTTSADEKDVMASYELHANCYITKPIDMNEFIGAARQIDEFWFSIVKLSPA